MSEMKKSQIIDLLDDDILSEALDLHEKIADNITPAVETPAVVLKPKSSHVSRFLRYSTIIAASFIVVFAFIPGLVRVMLPANDGGPGYSDSGSWWSDFFSGILGNAGGNSNPDAAGTTAGIADTTAPEWNSPETTYNCDSPANTTDEWNSPETTDVGNSPEPYPPDITEAPETTTEAPETTTEPPETTTEPVDTTIDAVSTDDFEPAE